MRRGFVTNELLIVGAVFAVLLAIGLGVASGLGWNPLAGVGIAIGGFVLFYLVLNAPDIWDQIRSREPGKISSFDQLWIQLSSDHYRGFEDGEAELKDIAMPWEHPKQEVRKTWNLITDPANLTLLEQRLTEDLNPFARKVTAEAKRQCEERARKPTQSQNKRMESNG